MKNALETSQKLFHSKLDVFMDLSYATQAEVDYFIFKLPLAIESMSVA
jgi:hypothetical protein